MKYTTISSKANNEVVEFVGWYHIRVARSTSRHTAVFFKWKILLVYSTQNTVLSTNGLTGFPRSRGNRLLGCLPLCPLMTPNGPSDSTVLYLYGHLNVSTQSSWSLSLIWWMKMQGNSCGRMRKSDPYEQSCVEYTTSNDSPGTTVNG